MKKKSLWFNIETLVYTSRKTGEIYVEVANQEEFENLRHEAIVTDRKCKEDEQIKQQIRVNKTPIYYDAKQDFYYYPKMGLDEVGDYPRQLAVVGGAKGPLPLKYVKKLDEYVDLETKEMYIQVQTPQEFEMRRKERLMELKVDAEMTREKEEGIEIVARKTPIFFDDDKNVYYYPQRALLEDVVVERTIVPYRGQLEYQKKKDVYIDPDAHEVYIQVRVGFKNTTTYTDWAIS